MADTIYNFFNFLEKKTGKTLEPKDNLRMKLNHAKEKIGDEELAKLPLESKIIYFPERVSKKDLVVKGAGFILPEGLRKIPEGLKVPKGILHVPASIDQVTDNVQAESVAWGASSDYYPKSFNGATFKKFSITSNKAATKLPENVKVTEGLAASYSGLKELPEGLHTSNITIAGTTVNKLPSRLVCDRLDLRGLGDLREIPEGVVVRSLMIVDVLPTKIPKHLEEVISIGGRVTLRLYRTYEALPEVSVAVRKKVHKGKGLQLDIDGNLEVLSKLEKLFDRKYDMDSAIDSLKQQIEGSSRISGVKWDTLTYILEYQEPSTDHSIGAGLYRTHILKGKDKEGREVALFNDTLISNEGKASVKSYKYNWNISDVAKKRLLFALFPKSEKGEREVKGIPIRNLMSGPGSKEVRWLIGRKTRQGFGVAGQAKDLIPSLHVFSRDTMAQEALRYKVTWGPMIVFDNRGSINVITRSNEQRADGKYLYFDKYGSGQGMTNKLFYGPDYTTS